MISIVPITHGTLYVQYIISIMPITHVSCRVCARMT
jgi:hypothetical protein